MKQIVQLLIIALYIYSSISISHSDTLGAESPEATWATSFNRLKSV